MTTQELRFPAPWEGVGFKALRQYNPVRRVLEAGSHQGRPFLNELEGRLSFRRIPTSDLLPDKLSRSLASIVVDLLGDKDAEIADFLRCHVKKINVKTKKIIPLIHCFPNPHDRLRK